MSKISAQEATERLREHFASLSNLEFVENVQKYCSDGIKYYESNFPTTRVGTGYMDQITLFQPQPTKIPLKAYLACALTGLAEVERQDIFQLSDEISRICRLHNIELYEPRKHTDPILHQDVTDQEVFKRDRERVLESDLLIVLAHHPSWGAGEELDFAYNALLPMIIISPDDVKVSRMVTGIPALKVHLTYSDRESLVAELDRCLTNVRPVLEERKLAFSKNDENIVGKNIRLCREELDLTREDVVALVPGLTAEALADIETSLDRISNPSLIQLRQIATVLKTTVAELIEPDLNERVMGYLQEMLDGRRDNRFSEVSRHDRNRLLRRIIYRVLDSLDRDEPY